MKSKTETQITEENINKLTELKFNLRLKRVTTTPIAHFNYNIQVVEEKSKEHKASCQRDVPKLKKIKESIVYVENELCHHLLDEMIKDKEQAIKLYDEAGI